jgi:hypothetical protein
MDECPYIQPDEPNKTLFRLQLVPLPLSSETDAIRSID